MVSFGILGMFDMNHGQRGVGYTTHDFTWSVQCQECFVIYATTRRPEIIKHSSDKKQRIQGQDIIIVSLSIIYIYIYTVYVYIYIYICVCVYVLYDSAI